MLILLLSILPKLLLLQFGQLLLVVKILIMPMEIMEPLHVLQLLILPLLLALLSLDVKLVTIYPLLLENVLLAELELLPVNLHQLHMLP
jgi:hypothetical protein